MRLKSFQVEKFRNVVDSGEVAVEEHVTCLVGKNEAGKSALLEALYLFNPAYGEGFIVEDQYPRWLNAKDRRAGDLSEATPIAIKLELEDHEVAEVEDTLGEGVLTNNNIKVSKRYSGGTLWSLKWSEEAAVANLLAEFPSSVVDALNGQDTLDGLREALDALVPGDEDFGDEGPGEEDADDEDTGLSDNDINAARAVLTDKGLDNTGVWDQLVRILKPVGAENCVVAGQAAFRYSLMSPPQRAVLTTWRCLSGWSAASVATGGRWLSERWGRCVL